MLQPKKGVLSREAQAKIQNLADEWFKAKEKGKKSTIHESASSIRDSAGLKAGKDYDPTTGKSTKSYEEKAYKSASPKPSELKRNTMILSGGEANIVSSSNYNSKTPIRGELMLELAKRKKQEKK